MKAEIDSYNHNLSSWSFLGTLGYVARGLRDLPGRKAIVVLSDGFDANDPSKQRLITDW